MEKQKRVVSELAQQSSKRKKLMKAEEEVSTSQSTVVSESDHPEVIPLLYVNRSSGLYYYRMSTEGPIPLINLLRQVFTSCTSCVLTPTKICEHVEHRLFLGYLSLKAQFGSTMYGNYRTSDVPSFCTSIKLSGNLKKCFNGYEVLGDGNCFFSAVSFTLSLDTVFGRAIRRCGQIALDLDDDLKCKLEKLLPSDISEQQFILSNDGEWASRHTAFITSEVISRPVVVYTYKRNSLSIIGSTYNARSNKEYGPVYLWLFKRHFSPLILKPGKNAPAANYEIPEFRPPINKSLKDYLKSCQDGTNSETLKSPPQLQETEHLPRATNVASATSTLVSEFRDTSIPGKKGFQCQDDENYVKVLKFVGVDFENLQSSTDTVKLNQIRRYVTSTEMWDLFSKQVLRTKKLSKAKEKSAQRKIFQTHRSKKGRELFVQTLAIAGIHPRLQSMYLEICNEQFGTIDISLSVEKTTCEETFGSSSKNCDTSSEQKIDDINQELLPHQDDFPSDTEISWRDEMDNASSASSIKEVEQLSTPTENENGPCENENNVSDSKPSQNAYDAASHTKTNKILHHKVEAVCEILNIKEADLNFQPPTKFKILVDPESFSQAFNFSTMKFIKKVWPLVISKFITQEQKVCCFRSERSPYFYTKENKFCRMNGHCTGNCEMTFEVIIKKTPKEGKPVKCTVTSEGKFELIQQEPTGRQLRGTDREIMKRTLKNAKAEEVYRQNILLTTGLQALHKNELQKTKGVLRKARSEVRKDGRLHEDPLEDLTLLRDKYRNDDDSNNVVQGFIQDMNPTPESFRIIMYSRKSLLLHECQSRSSYNRCYLDATGGVMQKITKKSPLLYALMGRNDNDVSYPIAEFILENGSNIEVMYCLARIREDLHKLKPTSNRLFTDIMVIDWSWSLIHGVCKGINNLEIIDYIENSFELLNGRGKWDSRHSCIFICSSHLITAARRLFSKTLTNSKLDRKIMNIALDVVARTQECYNFSELKKVLSVAVRTLGLQYIPESDLKQNVEFLSKKKQAIDILIKSEHDSETVQLSQDDETSNFRTLRDKSPFFRLFEDIKSEETKSGHWRSRGCIKNPYYNPTVLNKFGCYKMPLFPLWAAAVPRAVASRQFIRETNAVVESWFNTRKTNFSCRKNQNAADVVRDSFHLHQSSLKNAVVHDVAADVEKQKNATSRNEETELKPEQWKRSMGDKRKCKHYSKSKLYSSITETQPAKCLHPPKFGLPNTGNSCYVNAIFQMLMGLPAVYDEGVAGKLKQPLLTFFNGIFLQQPDHSVIKAAKSDLDEKLNDPLPSGTQQDAHDFLKKLFDWKKLKFLRQKMQISVETLVCCNNCSYESVSVTKELEIWTLANQSIEEALKDFVKPLVVPEYNCETCKNQGCTKTERIVRTSRYILIVKRLHGADTANDFVGVKVNVKKPFNKIATSIQVPTTEGVKLYQLSSFITHEGESLHSGHYRAYLTNGKSVICCDDASVFETKNHQGTLYIQLYENLDDKS